MQIGAIEMQNGSPIDMFIHKLNILKQQQLNFTYKNFQTHSLPMNPKNTPLGLQISHLFRLSLQSEYENIPLILN